MKLLRSEIISNETCGKGLYKIEVFSPYICRNAKAGQFVNVKCSPDGILDPLLRRPFSIYNVEKEYNVFSILYLEKGKGTKFLSDLKKGSNLNFAGPLGNAAATDDKSKNFLLVGGGIGIAPLYFLARTLIQKGKNIFFAAGFKDNNFIGWSSDLIRLRINYKIFTEDGSWGDEGLATDFVKENIKKYKGYKIYCCGPRDMLISMQDILAGKKISATALLEERMACGVGVCKGCAVKIKDGNSSFAYKTVCKDGPAFDLMEVIFD